MTYEDTAPTPVVFRPRLDDAHLVTVEKTTFELRLSSNEFQDSHGHLAYCSMLKPVYREKLAARGIAHEIPEGDDRERINAIKSRVRPRASRHLS